MGGTSYGRTGRGFSLASELFTLASGAHVIRTCWLRGLCFLLQLEELLDLAVLEEIQQELADQGDLGQGPSTCL